MSNKVATRNGSARYWDAEDFSKFITDCVTEGVVNLNGDDTDFLVSEQSPQALGVQVATGRAYIEVTVSGQQYKERMTLNDVELLDVDANSTGGDRVDAVIARIDVDVAPNADADNMGSVEVITGTGPSALSDGAIDTAVGSDGWIRLADITVPNGAGVIQDSDIADVRNVCQVTILPEEGDTRWVSLTEDQTINGQKTFGSIPLLPSSDPTNDDHAARKYYVDQAIASAAGQIITNEIAYGDTISEGDLLYYDRSTQRWQLVTSDKDTQRGDLVIALEDGVDGEYRQVLKEGLADLATSAVAPTFEFTTTNTLRDVGEGTTTYAQATVLDNDSGPECESPGTGSVRVQRNGTPAYDLKVWIVLCGNTSTKPGFGTGNSTLAIGQILASGSIAAGGITTSAVDHAFSLGSFRIPSNCHCAIVVTMGDMQLHSSNYYRVSADSGGGLSAWSLDSSYNWNGSFPFVFSLDTTSIDPWDEAYTVRINDGVDGAYGIGDDSGFDPWSRRIGHLVDATQFYFNPRETFDDFGPIAFTGDDVMEEVALSFRPHHIEFSIGYAGQSNNYVGYGRFSWQRTSSTYGQFLYVEHQQKLGSTASIDTTASSLIVSAGNDSGYNLGAMPMETGFLFYRMLKGNDSPTFYTSNSVQLNWRAS